VSEAILAQPSPGGEEGAILASRIRRAKPLRGRELVVTLARAMSFAVVAAVMLLESDLATVPMTPIVVLTTLYGILWATEIEVGEAMLVPVVVGLMPLLFLVPPGLAPVIAVVGAVGADLVPSSRSLRRALYAVATCWTIIPPALVVWACGQPTEGTAFLGTAAAAVLAYVVADNLNNAVNLQGGLGAPFEETVRTARSNLIDLLIAPFAVALAAASFVFTYAFLAALPLVAFFRLIARERASRVEAANELASAYRGTALLLSTVIDADDGYTGYHSRGVVGLAASVATELRLSERDVRLTEFAGLLHDVGKIRIPNAIINKPGPLTPEEWEIVRRHPSDGADMLEGVGGFLAEVGQIVRFHHERWDGSGYPEGRFGPTIPQIARIIAVCDAFSAITTDRAYRPGRSVNEALGEIHACAGTQFDPAVVQALVVVAGRELGATVELPPLTQAA
jgi:putative nucleotidyltransferase with HDIG domain